MKLNKTIFRAYDIRGIYGSDFDLKGANLMGKAYGTYLIRSSKKKGTLNVVIGRDGRIHSEDVQSDFIEGVRSTGINVTNVGLSPSPLLYFSICEGKFDGGVSVTASHNPKEYNGFKLQRKHAESICGDEIQEIYNMCINGDFIVSDKIGEEKHDSYFVKYLKKIESIVGSRHSEKFSSREKIVIDGGNGVAGPFASLILKHLGYSVIDLYCDIDGNFPNHKADPEDESTLKDLKNKVKSENAFLGIAFDGDGDRIGLVDTFGNNYNADKLLILLARDLLSRAGPQTIIYELNITSLLKEEVEKFGGKALMCKTGHSFVEHEMKKYKALLGGENSGHLFFGENYFGFDDALLAASILAKILIRDHKIPIFDHFKDLPKTYEYSKKYEVTEINKFQIIEHIAEKLGKKYKVNRLDGVRVDFKDNAWCVIRASNTSPKVQLKIEARSEGHLENIKNEIIKLMPN